MGATTVVVGFISTVISCGSLVIMVGAVFSAAPVAMGLSASAAFAVSVANRENNSVAAAINAPLKVLFNVCLKKFLFTVNISSFPNCSFTNTFYLQSNNLKKVSWVAFFIR